MRAAGIGLAIGLLLATAASSPAFAAKGEVTKEQRAKGMAAVPDLLTQANAQCQLADARLIGESVDPKTKAKSQLYEAACTGAEGLIIDEVPGAPPLVFTCAEAATPGPDGKPGGTQCALPGNSNPEAGLQPFVVVAGTPCTIDKYRALGHSESATLFELVCREGGGGYIMQTSAPPRTDKPVTLNPCVGYADSGNVKCILTDRATQLAAVDRLVAESGKPCAVKDRAFVGVSKTNDMYYEVACQDGKGYMLEQLPNGKLSRTVDCAAADSIGGGCKLTDARQAKTEQNSLYTRLARKAGFACDVSGYAPLPNSAANQGKEVVELACSNRPDGGVAIFTPSEVGSAVYDCAHSELVGYRCSLSKPAAAYPKLTADLKALGKGTCTVASARAVGVSANQTGYVEVGCSDGLQGYMIEYALTPLRAKTAIVCSDARGINGGCTLPGNNKKG
ncbi:MAG: hypothetical protein ABI376_09820 [Caulobacteraceae bacterium]